jgi:hypothetical protein
MGGCAVGVAEGGIGVECGSTTRTVGDAFTGVAGGAVGGVTAGAGVVEADGVGVGVAVSTGEAVTAITTMRGGGSPPTGGTTGGGRLRAASTRVTPKSASSMLISRGRLPSGRPGKR